MTRSLTHTASCTPRARRRSILTLLADLHAVWRQRQRLNTLDDAALRDMGLTRKEASREARRAFWDAPEIWRR